MSVGTTKPRMPLPRRLVGLRPDHGDVGDRAVGDPHLGAVEHPVVAVALGPGPHPGRVGAEIRLGQPEAADRLAGGHPRQPGLSSAPRCRTSRSRTSPAIPAPTPCCARRSRRPPAPCRPARRPPRWCRRSRSPAGACRADRASRPRASGSRSTVAVLEPVGDVRPDPAGRRSPGRSAWMSRSSSLSSASTSSSSSGAGAGHRSPLPARRDGGLLDLILAQQHVLRRPAREG